MNTDNGSASNVSNVRRYCAYINRNIDIDKNKTEDAIDFRIEMMNNFETSMLWIIGTAFMDDIFYSLRCKGESFLSCAKKHGGRCEMIASVLKDEKGNYLDNVAETLEEEAEDGQKSRVYIARHMFVSDPVELEKLIVCFPDICKKLNIFRDSVFCLCVSKRARRQIAILEEHGWFRKTLPDGNILIYNVGYNIF